jgi:hypothetical protein
MGLIVFSNKRARRASVTSLLEQPKNHCSTCPLLSGRPKAELKYQLTEYIRGSLEGMLHSEEDFIIVVQHSNLTSFICLL